MACLSRKGCSENSRVMRATLACEQKGGGPRSWPRDLGTLSPWPKVCVAPSPMASGGVGLL